MPDFIEKEGKTVESAIEEALTELNIEEKDAEIEYLTKEVKVFLE